MEQHMQFSVSMEEDLLRQFDHQVEYKGYTFHFMTIHDIVRDMLIAENVKNSLNRKQTSVEFLFNPDLSIITIGKKKSCLNRIKQLFSANLVSVNSLLL